MTEGRFANRQDHHHVLAQLPPLGGPENAKPAFVRAVEKWRPRDPSGRELGGLVLMGPTGDGKSTALRHLALWLLARVEAATSMLFVTASDLVEDRDLVERAKRVRFLMLDDVGKEKDPHNRLFSVLDYRHTRFPSFLTTGINAVDLDTHYDSATIRRMFEFRGARVQVVSTFAAKPKLSQVGGKL